MLPDGLWQRLEYNSEVLGQVIRILLNWPSLYDIIASVHECLYACMFVCVCVCVSAPKAINN